MNNQSLSHSHVQKQQKSSWIDEPFQLGTNAVKGFKPMSNKRNLYNYAEDLVGRYAKYDGDSYDLSLSQLPDDEQNELARLYIESIDREIEWAHYGSDESINSSFICSMLSMLKDDSKEARENFAKTTRKNILIYYKASLEAVLGEACASFLNMQMNEQGYFAHQDMEHGDVVWGKS